MLNTRSSLYFHMQVGTVNLREFPSFKKSVLRKCTSRGFYTTCPETKGVGNFPLALDSTADLCTL